MAYMKLRRGGDRGKMDCALSSKDGADSNDGNERDVGLNNAASAAFSDGEELEDGPRIGDDYQAITPEFIPLEERCPDQCPERELQAWSPAPQIVNTKLDEYIQTAWEKYGVDEEQALNVVFGHKYDVDLAVQDLANSHSVPDEWSTEEKMVFERAFESHGKSFRRIRKKLPEKSIAQLVRYYYDWKNARTGNSANSLMDAKVRELQDQEENQEETVMDESEDDKESQMPDPSMKDGTKFKSKSSAFKNSNQPPEGLHINHEDLEELATGSMAKEDAILKAMDREIVTYKRTAQVNKQLLDVLQRNAKATSIDSYRIPDPAISAKWTNEERLLVVLGIHKFGKDFKTIAEVIGTKTESHVRSFYANSRHRYNLDAALKDYEAKQRSSPTTLKMRNDGSELLDSGEVDAKTNDDAVSVALSSKCLQSGMTCASVPSSCNRNLEKEGESNRSTQEEASARDKELPVGSDANANFEGYVGDFGGDGVECAGNGDREDTRGNLEKPQSVFDITCFDSGFPEVGAGRRKFRKVPSVRKVKNSCKRQRREGGKAPLNSKTLISRSGVKLLNGVEESLSVPTRPVTLQLKTLQHWDEDSLLLPEVMPFSGNNFIHLDSLPKFHVVARSNVSDRQFIDVDNYSFDTPNDNPKINKLMTEN